MSCRSKLYYGGGRIPLDIGMMKPAVLPLVHRVDMREDGSEGHSYYLELTKLEYEWLVGYLRLYISEEGEKANAYKNRWSDVPQS